MTDLAPRKQDMGGKTMGNSILKNSMMLLLFICLMSMWSDTYAKRSNRREIFINDSVPRIEKKKEIYSMTNIYVHPSNITWIINMRNSHFRDSSFLSFKGLEEFIGMRIGRGIPIFSISESRFDSSRFELVNINMQEYKIEAYRNDLYHSTLYFQNLHTNGLFLSWFGSNFTNSFVRMTSNAFSGGSFLGFNMAKMKRTSVYIDGFTLDSASIISFAMAQLSSSVLGHSVLDISVCILKDYGKIGISGMKVTEGSMVKLAVMWIRDNANIELYATSMYDSSSMEIAAINAYDSSKIDLSPVHLYDRSKISFRDCKFFDNSKIDLSGLNLYDRSAIYFRNCKFSDNSKFDLSRLNLTEGAVLEFRRCTIKTNSPLDFYGANLYGRTAFFFNTYFPEYVDFRFVRIGANEVDFSWVRPPDGKKIKIALWGSDIEKIRLNTHFEIWFPDDRVAGALSLEDKKLVFSRLLAKYRSENNDHLYQYFEGERQKLIVAETSNTISNNERFHSQDLEEGHPNTSTLVQSESNNGRKGKKKGFFRWLGGLFGNKETSR
jgi:hypothetical protein